MGKVMNIRGIYISVSDLGDGWCKRSHEGVYFQ